MHDDTLRLSHSTLNRRLRRLLVHYAGLRHHHLRLRHLGHTLLLDHDLRRPVLIAAVHHKRDPHEERRDEAAEDDGENVGFTLGRAVVLLDAVVDQAQDGLRPGRGAPAQRTNCAIGRGAA